MNLNMTALRTAVEPLLPGALFVTVSGSHLYGFSSVDSDVDLRGAFLAPIDQILGLIADPETIEQSVELQGIEVELVGHEAAKYLHLLGRNNGYILEQVFSPLVVMGKEFLDRLRPLAKRCVTRGCHHHYRGFYQQQRKMLEREPAKKAKTLLYAYRVLLTGIHLLRTGEVEANLTVLNGEFRLPFVPELIERKHSAEHGTLNELDWSYHTAQLDRWAAELEQAHQASTLPEVAPREELHCFLIELRREGWSNG